MKTQDMVAELVGRLVTECGLRADKQPWTQIQIQNLLKQVENEAYSRGIEQGRYDVLNASRVGR